MTPTIRPFRRADRDQLTALLNAHAEAVVPGSSMPVNTVLAQLEREPGEFIVDPWVSERLALVAEETNGIVAAALMHRHRADADVPDSYRNAGEIRWLLFAPLSPAANPHWHDGHHAGRELLSACLAQFERWACSVIRADFSLPTPGVYGIPQQWPHIAKLFASAGFSPTRRERVHLAELSAPATPADPPHPGMSIQRCVGMNGTRFAATLDSDMVGYIEVERVTGPDRRQGPVVADIGNLWIADHHERTGIGSWLLQHAAQWLRVGRVDVLLAYSTPDEMPMNSFLARSGFANLTTTERGWTRSRSAGTSAR